MTTGATDIHPITNSSQWVERFSMMAAVMSTRFPHKEPELLAYQATIVKAETTRELLSGSATIDVTAEMPWLAKISTDLCQTHNKAFTGRARAIRRCSYCLDSDHNGSNYPKNPNRPLLGYFPAMDAWLMPAPPQPMPITPPREPYEGRCNKQQYLHICTSCNGPHPVLQCTQRQPPSHSRSHPRRDPTTATLPPTSKSSNNSSDLRQSLLELLTMIRILSEPNRLHYYN